MKKPLLIISALFISSTAWAADWTPHLKSLQNNCEISEKLASILSKEKAMPKALKGDIVSHRFREYDHECGGCSPFITVKLKNAKAFGYRLKAIEYGYGYGQDITLYFHDDKFMQLMPTFTLSFKDVTIQPNQKVVYSVTKDDYGEKILSYKKIAYPKNIKASEYYNEFSPLVGGSINLRFNADRLVAYRATLLTATF